MHQTWSFPFGFLFAFNSKFHCARTMWTTPLGRSGSSEYSQSWSSWSSRSTDHEPMIILVKQRSLPTCLDNPLLCQFTLRNLPRQTNTSFQASSFAPSKTLSVASIMCCCDCADCCCCGSTCCEIFFCGALCGACCCAQESRSHHHHHHHRYHSEPAAVVVEPVVVTTTTTKTYTEQPVYIQQQSPVYGKGV